MTGGELRRLSLAGDGEVLLAREFDPEGHAGAEAIGADGASAFVAWQYWPCLECGSAGGLARIRD